MLFLVITSLLFQYGLCSWVEGDYEAAAASRSARIRSAIFLDSVLRAVGVGVLGWMRFSHAMQVGANTIVLFIDFTEAMPMRGVGGSTLNLEPSQLLLYLRTHYYTRSYQTGEVPCEQCGAMQTYAVLHMQYVYLTSACRR